MPTSTTSGRTINKILSKKRISPAPIPGLVSNFCKRTEDMLKKQGNKIVKLINGEHWTGAYDRLTEFRTLTQIWSEACPIRVGRRKTTTKPTKGCPTIAKKEYDKQKQAGTLHAKYKKKGGWKTFVSDYCKNK